MSAVFINTTRETFTKSKSGAIGTWVWEVCQAAARAGDAPWVISMADDGEPYPWPNTIFIPYPNVDFDAGWKRLLRKAYVLQTQRGGWFHMRHESWCERVGDAIEREGLAGEPLVLHNDLQLAVVLRQRFPNAFILHLAHNQNCCADRFKNVFGASVNVAAAVSDFTARWNSEYFSVPVKTIFNGVNIEKFRPAANPPSGVPIINFTGRTVREKAPDLLLKAALKLADKTRAFAVQIVGSVYLDGKGYADAYQAELDSLVGQIEAKGVRVTRTGFVSREEIAEVIGRAQIHVIPSRWDEPFSLAAIEGMAAGLAVITSDTGGLPEVVGDAGFVFERESVTELAVILHTLVTDEVVRREYQRKARERAATLTWDRTWQTLKESLPAYQENEPALV